MAAAIDIHLLSSGAKGALQRVLRQHLSSPVVRTVLANLCECAAPHAFALAIRFSPFWHLSFVLLSPLSSSSSFQTGADGNDGESGDTSVLRALKCVWPGSCALTIRAAHPPCCLAGFVGVLHGVLVAASREEARGVWG